MQKLKPSEFEGRWQQQWVKHRIYQPDLSKAKKPFYNLMMFPYPSAEGLHVGNMYAFTGADIYGRFKRMLGYDIFEPIGLDGFGIHSENYAIKVGRHPAEQAKISEKNFYRQLHAIGNGFAWENRLETYDPDYYRWTQWIFIQMFKHGLAYRKKSPVNFCPSCKTVLSDEQVIDGYCERCKTLVEKREMEQWFFKITAYAEKLLQNTYRKDFQWTEKVKVGQRNWIGKKEGIVIKYQVSNIKYQIECFTTRPDTNFGATFVVLAPEHPFVEKLLNPKSHREWQAETEVEAMTLPVWRDQKKLQEIRDYIDKSKKKSEKDRITEGREKTGVFTGYYCINQLTHHKMSIWISDFVLGHVGTGAVVGVPGHDLRDFQFAQKFDLPIIRVVVGKDGDTSPITREEQVQEEEGTMINSGFLNSMDIKKAIGAMMDYLGKKGWGKRVVTYKLRDWCISRQRYWGAPIPMVYCGRCAEKGVGWVSENIRVRPLGAIRSDSEALMPGWFPVPEEELPVLLPPNVKDWKPEGTGKGPLAKIESFVKTKCPKCGGDADRETDVCDTFLDSSWYFLRYPSLEVGSGKWELGKGNGKQERGSKNPISHFNIQPLTSNLTLLPWDSHITRRWLPVTQYIGGAEHTVLHLLYARFVWMCFYDWGLFDFSAQGRPASGWEEPFSHFYAHGLIIAEGAKMSKSKGNVVIPDEYIRAYGADTLRTYLMFLGPFDAGGDFRDTGIAGMHRFLSRVWRLVNEFINQLSLKTTPGVAGRSVSVGHDSFEVEESRMRLMRIMHRTIKEVTEDLENLRYNTAISHIMIYVKELQQLEIGPSAGGWKAEIAKEALQTLLLLLAPFSPHMTEELWQAVRHLGGGRLDPPAGGESHDSPDGGGIGKEFSSIHLHPWPAFDPKYLTEDEVTIVIQINGKTRDVIKVAVRHLGGSRRDSPEAEESISVIAKKSQKVQKYISGKSIRKTIYVPGKLINFVV